MLTKTTQNVTINPSRTSLINGILTQEYDLLINGQPVVTINNGKTFSANRYDWNFDRYDQITRKITNIDYTTGAISMEDQIPVTPEEFADTFLGS